MKKVRNAMEFDPRTLSVTVDWPYLRQQKMWRRQTTALFAHELTHLIEWLFIYRMDARAWNAAVRPEARADKVQGLVLKLLGW